MVCYRKFKVPFSNIFFIRWTPKKISPIHSHPGVESNMLVLKGKLNETLYMNLGDEKGYYVIDNKVITPYQCSHINDKKGSHTIQNISDKYAWSIHYQKSLEDI